jgi:hypothetical protein
LRLIRPESSMLAYRLRAQWLPSLGEQERCSRFFLEREKEMANGSLHPKERVLKERLGKDYEVETPPLGAVVIGEHSSDDQAPLSQSMAKHES